MAEDIDWDAEAVLEQGVPPLPAYLKPGNEVPVAYWRRGNVGAVLSIAFDPEDDEEPFSQDIQIWVREQDGLWSLRSKGGSDWPLPFGTRPEGGRPTLTGYASGAPDPDSHGSVWVASGIAPAGVARVRVVEGGYDDVVDVESRTGAFLVRLKGLGWDATITDAAGAPDQ